MILADLFLPRKCCICGVPLLPEEHHICLCCFSQLPLTHFENLSHNPVSDRINDLIDSPPPYAYATSLFYYRGAYKEITRLLKYQRHFSMGRYFSTLLADNIRQSAYLFDIDAVAPLPLHWTRRLKRGYNQSEIIARVVAKSLDLPCRTDMLVRKRRTRSQTKYHGEERLSNVSGAFYAPLRSAPRHLLLVDDVLTTGSSLLAAYNALRARYGESMRISFATLAFVPKD